MGLTKQEKLNRVFENAVKTKDIYDLIRALKSEMSGSQSDTLDELIKLLYPNYLK